MTAPATLPIEIYLGKNGQTFGPYTAEQFAEIQASADYATYTYIWDGREANPDWKPIQKAAAIPAPPAAKRGPGAPPPDAAANASASAPEPEIAQVIPIRGGARAKESTRAQAAPMLRGYDAPGIEALCHDSRNVITGTLAQVTDAGCELICPESSAAPSFGAQSPVMLNLLDSKSGQAMNVAARLAGMRREGGKWSLKVLWDACPELLVRQIEKAA